MATRLLDRFEEVGLIDDEAFARAWVASRQPGKGLARRALAQELRRKGIDDEVAKRGARRGRPGRRGGRGPGAGAQKLRIAGPASTDTVATRRLVGMLARKGYPSGMAFAVVSDELEADESRRSP